MLAIVGQLGLWLAGVVGIDADDLSARAFKIIGGIALTVAVVAGLLLGKWVYDRNLIARYEDKQDAQVVKAIPKAMDAATNAVQAQRNDFDATTAKIEENTGNAKRNDPAKGATVVGPVSRGYFDSLPSAPTHRKTK